MLEASQRSENEFDNNQTIQTLGDKMNKLENGKETGDYIVNSNDNGMSSNKVQETIYENCEPVVEESKEVNNLNVDEIDESRPKFSETEESSINKSIKKKFNKRIAAFDSDSDSENNLLDNMVTENTESEDIPDAIQNGTKIQDTGTEQKLKSRKRITLLPSDSEDEVVDLPTLSDEEFSSNQQNMTKINNSNSDDIKSKSIHKRNLINSDSDSESDTVSNKKSIGSKYSHKQLADSDSDAESETNSSYKKSLKSKKTNKKLNNKKLTASDSDSDNSIKLPNKKRIIHKSTSKRDSNSSSDNDITPHNKSFSDDIPQEATVYTTNSKGELIAEESKPKPYNWSALCDSDSPDEGLNNERNHSDNANMSEDEVIKPIAYKRKPKSKAERDQKKLTAQDAAKLRLEIQSESQRMTRESSLSLPYHRPKSFTLKEFLSRRPKLASTVPLKPNTRPSVAMKMSIEQLEIISKKLEERHKEVQEFYKSDSEKEETEDDDKDDADYIPPGLEENLINENKKESESTSQVQENIQNGNSTENSEHQTNKIIEPIENQKNSMEIVNDVHKDTEGNTQENVMEVVSNDNVHTDINIQQNFEINPENKTNNDIENQDIPETPTLDNDVLLVNQNNYENLDKNMEIDKLNMNAVVESTLVNNGDSKISEIIQTNVDSVDSNISANINKSNNSDLSSSGNLEASLDPQQSMDYEFNLDDMDENTETIARRRSGENLPDADMPKNIDKGGENLPDSEISISNDQFKNLCNNNEDHLADSEMSSSKDQFEIMCNDQNRSEYLLDSETSISKDHFKNDIQEKPAPVDFSELDKEIENFNRDTASPEKETPKLSKLELLKEKLAHIQPRLTSSPNNIIDLDNVPNSSQINKLMERFAKHTAKTHHHKDKVKLNIVTVESGGEIHKETVAVHVDDEEDTAIEEKPGVRLQRLRNELQAQIAQQRLKLWQNRTTNEGKNDEMDPYEGEKAECGADDVILDNDEEEEMTESSDDDMGVDDEIEDAVETEPKIKSAFVDDEADESDIEGDDEENGNGDDEENDEASDNEKDEGILDNDIKGSDKGDENKENEFEEDGKEETTPFKKPLKRILKGFTEDSDEDDDSELTSTIHKISEKLNRSNEDSNSTSQDDYIPPYQIANQNTPIRESSKDNSNFDLKFLTPVSYITGIQNLTNSASKIQSPANVPSPLKEANWHTTLQKKLFANSVISDSQAEAMEQLCSVKYPDSQDVSQNDSSEAVFRKPDTNNSEEISSTAPPSSQDLLNVCSGDFEQEPTTQDLLNVCSGEFTGVSQVLEPTQKSNLGEEVKSLGEDQDMIISQLLNEEEMEAFKKKFDSPIVAHTQRTIVDREEEEKEVAATGGIIDSDDDEGILEVKKKKKNQKKLTFSDDSSDDEEENEEIDLQDEIDEDDEDGPQEVNYDSEENEIEFTHEKENENVKLTDFFENEAELSESEWGSADEDEKDLDAFEIEQGDAEKFDEKQMRTDLERIHMRRMLDDDNREVKLLQEMLLDDGELHGSGRERQFRWKNIDYLDTGEEEKKNSDDEICFEEEESEEQWRRKRHEREIFLKEKQSQRLDEENDLLSSSEIFKIGHKFIQRSLSNSQGNNSSEKPKVINNSPSVKSSLSFVHKRGSFLSRGDQVLQRLAEYNKVTTTTSEVVARKTKNSKNFLFQTVQVQEETTKLSIFNKRKATDGTPKVIKKLRLTENLSPAIRKKKSNKPEIKTKLFSVS